MLQQHKSPTKLGVDTKSEVVNQEEDEASINSTQNDSEFAAVEEALVRKSAEDRRAAGGKASSPFLPPSLLLGYPPGKVNPDLLTGRLSRHIILVSRSPLWEGLALQ